MCYFIHVKVMPQRKQEDAQAVLERAAKTHKLYLRNFYARTQVTDGHCSCDYVQQNEHAISLTAFLGEIVKDDAVKSLEVGWAWSKPMDMNASVERLTLQEFLARNDAENLSPNIWYKLNDPDKYHFSH